MTSIRVRDVWWPVMGGAWLRHWSGRQLLAVVTCLMLCSPVSIETAVMFRTDDDVTGNTPEIPHHDTPLDNGELDLTRGIITNEMYMCENEPFVVIFVHSGLNNFAKRTAIRDSWGSVARDPEYKTKLMFILGVAPDDVTSIRIREEVEDFHDILQFNIADAYKNLSLKSLAMIQWVNRFCDVAKYVVKVDDDTFLNTPLLIKDLHDVIHERFVMGDIIAGARPIRDRKSKYFTPIRQFKGTMYPTYLSGAAYVISGDVIPDLTEAAKKTELFWLEDVYITGLLARRARAKQIFNGKFGIRIDSVAPCQLTRIIALHRISPGEMTNAWSLIHTDNTDCTQGS